MHGRIVGLYKAVRKLILAKFRPMGGQGGLTSAVE